MLSVLHGNKGQEIPCFLSNINEKVKSGILKDRVYGRNSEINRIRETLLRRRKPNPLIIGEAGVGKTAIVQELVHSLYDDTCPCELEDFSIYELDLNGMLANTSQRGQYEQNILDVISFLEEDDREEKVVFIDEFHNFTKTDGSEGSHVLASMFKPALSRGNFKCIAATTLDEYTKHILPDGAINRRFQPIIIETPTVSETLEIISSVKSQYERFHGCEYDPSALRSCVEIADEYIPYRNNPDKSIDLLDEIGSQQNILISSGKIPPGTPIKADDVLLFCNDFLNLSVPNSKTKQISLVEQKLTERILGQDHAISTFMKCLRRKSTNLRESTRPIATLLLHGPTATGKSEICEIIAKHYFNSSIKFDMSEYIDSISVSSLIGTPPGYVGYDEGGLLTNAIKKTPHTIVVFDNIDQAHPNVTNLILRLIDEGKLHDNTGRLFDFSNALIVLTTNINTENKDVGFNVEMDMSRNYYDLKGYFRPEFLNRIDEIINFKPLRADDLNDLCKILIIEKLNQIKSSTRQDVSEILNESFDNVEMLTKQILQMETSRCARSIKSNIEITISELFSKFALTVKRN